MSKIVSLGLAISFFLIAAPTDRPRLEKYKKLEAYEIRPGILMFPRFTAEDEFCEIGLQRLGYSPEVVRVSSDLFQEEIDKVLDELVPAEERGKRSTDFPDSLYVITGATGYRTMEFENVRVVIALSVGASTRKTFRSEDVVATIKWKKRVCKWELGTSFGSNNNSFSCKAAEIGWRPSHGREKRLLYGRLHGQFEAS